MSGLHGQSLPEDLKALCKTKFVFFCCLMFGWVLDESCNVKGENERGWLRRKMKWRHWRAAEDGTGDSGKQA